MFLLKRDVEISLLKKETTSLQHKYIKRTNVLELISH